MCETIAIFFSEKSSFFYFNANKKYMHTNLLNSKFSSLKKLVFYALFNLLQSLQSFLSLWKIFLCIFYVIANKIYRYMYTFQYVDCQYKRWALFHICQRFLVCLCPRLFVYFLNLSFFYKFI